jgi:hypothetical protein
VVLLIYRFVSVSVAMTISFLFKPKLNFHLALNYSCEKDKIGIDTVFTITEYDFVLQRAIEFYGFSMNINTNNQPIAKLTPRIPENIKLGILLDCV